MLNQYFLTKKLLSISLVVVLILLMVASATAAGGMDGVPPKSVTVFAGVSGGSWNILGAIMAEIFNKSGVPSSMEIGGGVSNIISVSNGEGELGLTVTLNPALAFNGEPPYDQKYENVAGLGFLSSNIVQILVRKDSGVNNVADLKGKPFASQPVGTSSQKAFEDVLKVYGLNEEDLKISRGGQSEGAALVKDRHVVGLTAIGDIPSATFAELALLTPMKVLEVPGDKLKKLQEINMGYVSKVIPAGTYTGQSEDVVGVGSDLILIVRKDMPDEEVYWIAKALAENVEDLQGAYDAMKGFTVEAFSEIAGIEIHPGAKMFFDEYLKK